MIRLGSLLLASMAVYGTLLWGPHLGLHITRFLAAYAGLTVLCLAAWRTVHRRPSPGSWVLIWVGAVVFRGLLVTAPPQLSDDIYRYIWDGRVLLEGINPFRYAPSAPELSSLRDVLWTHVNNPQLPTIYPPLLQGVFAAAAWMAPTVFSFKAVFAVFDLAAGVFLFSALRRVGRGSWAVLYLWHPAVVTEFAGQGHADAVGLCFLAAALWGVTRRREFFSGLALTLAGLVKFFPWTALPALVRRRTRWWPVLYGLTVAAAYLPFTGGGVSALGSLGTFTLRWKANAFLFEAFAWLPEPWDRVAALLPALAVLSWMLLRRRPWPLVYGWTVGVLLLFSPVVHPWYVLWLLPAALYTQNPAWLAWSFLAPLSYAVLPGFLATGVWAESIWIKLAVYVPVLALAARSTVMSRRAESSPC